MLKNYYIQKQKTLSYTVNSNDTVIATINENKAYAKRPLNRFLKIFSSLFLNAPKRMIIEGLKLDIITADGQQLGYVMRAAGLKKDWLVYSSDGTFVTTLHATVKISAPAISSLDDTGKTVLHATSSFGATDFSVTTNDELVASIRKRSLLYDSIKENLLKHDVYHIEQKFNDEQLTFTIIAMTIAIDIDFFAGE